MTALFGKNKKDENKNKKKLDDVKVEETKQGDLSVQAEEKQEEQSESSGVGSSAFSGVVGQGAYRVLRGFYVSEKSSIAGSIGHYIFKVCDTANKSEISKEVSKLFNVKVKDVKILNMPEKRRDFGKHPGAKSGFKKAIVILKEGFTIGQAKP